MQMREPAPNGEYAIFCARVMSVLFKNRRPINLFEISRQEGSFTCMAALTDVDLGTRMDLGAQYMPAW
jgi:hypothetical protein